MELVSGFILLSVLFALGIFAGVDLWHWEKGIKNIGREIERREQEEEEGER